MSKIRLHGSSSGYMEIAPPAAASSATVTLPNSAGEVLLTDGSAASLTQIPRCEYCWSMHCWSYKRWWRIWKNSSS